MNKNSASTKSKKILIIEDEADICLLLNIMLNEKRIELDHVTNLGSAKDYLEKESPAIILLDNMLPDGLGLDFIDYVKQRYPAIKIVMITGFGGEAKDIAIKSGADVFLQKPFTKNQLQQSLQELLN